MGLVTDCFEYDVFIYFSLKRYNESVIEIVRRGIHLSRGSDQTSLKHEKTYIS